MSQPLNLRHDLRAILEDMIVDCVPGPCNDCEFVEVFTRKVSLRQYEIDCFSAMVPLLGHSIAVQSTTWQLNACAPAGRHYDHRYTDLAIHCTTNADYWGVPSHEGAHRGTVNACNSTAGLDFLVAHGWDL